MKIFRHLEVFVNSCWQCKDLHFPLAVCHVFAKLFPLFICKAGKKPQDLTVQTAALNATGPIQKLLLFTFNNWFLNSECICQKNNRVGTWLAKAIPHFSRISYDFVDIQHYVNHSFGKFVQVFWSIFKYILCIYVLNCYFINTAPWSARLEKLRGRNFSEAKICQIHIWLWFILRMKAFQHKNVRKG